jgi:hypothetical protein
MARKQYRLPLLDLILLGTIGISALAWFIHRKKKGALPPPPPKNSQSDTKAPVQIEDDSNFVKMMKDQVRHSNNNKKNAVFP